MMEAASTSETSVNFYQITRHNNPEDSHLLSVFFVVSLTTLSLLLFVVYLTTLFQYPRLYSVDFYSIVIRLPSSSEAGETRVRNMATEFCRRVPIVLAGFFNMP
jgi:hypothetical protein